MAERDRDWLEQRAIAFALGALEADEESRFRETVLGDPEFEALLSELSETPGHVPAALIARWSAAQRELGELERSLVENHLRSCSSCREELRIVGSVSRARRVPVTGRAWLPWFGGAALGAAAMALFLMFGSPGSPPLQGERIEVVSPRTMRGSETAILVLAPDARAFLLAVRLPTDAAPGAEGELVLTGPDGNRVLVSKLGPAPWSPPSTQLLVLGEQGFASGDYTARLHVSGEAAPRELGRFEIRIAPPPNASR